MGRPALELEKPKEPTSRDFVEAGIRRLSRHLYNNKPLPAEDLARAESLVADHAAMLEQARLEASNPKQYQSFDLAHMQMPAWVNRELKNEHALPDDLDNYIVKEATRSAHLAKTLAPLMRYAPEGPLVDIGTRSGFFPNHLKTMYGELANERDISGLDLKQELKTDGHGSYDFRDPKLANADKPIVREYGGNSMPYANASIAVATLNCVLHHIESPTRDPQPDSPELTAFLEELYRVMKPGGVVLITEDYMGKTKEDRENPANPYAKTVLGIDDLFYKNSLGSQRSQEEWVEILSRAGFVVDLEKHVGGYNLAGFPVIELVLKATKPLR